LGRPGPAPHRGRQLAAGTGDVADRQALLPLRRMEGRDYSPPPVDRNGRESHLHFAAVLALHALACRVENGRCLSNQKETKTCALFSLLPSPLASLPAV